MSLETRRRILNLLVIMSEGELLDVLAYAQTVYDQRAEQSGQNVHGRRSMAKRNTVE